MKSKRDRSPSKFSEHTAIDFNQYNVDIWCNAISYLTTKDITSLMSTCSFFHKHPDIKKRSGNWPKIVTGGDHTLILNSDNQLYGWGRNEFGQLGLQSQNELTSLTLCPVALQPNESIVKIVTKDHFSLILTNNGRLLGAGLNLCALNGIGTNYSDTFTPYLIELKEKEFITQIVAGINHCLVLTNTNRLLGCGSNSVGQLGLGNTPDASSFTPCNLLLENNELIVQMVAGRYHNFILTNAGRLLGCGLNMDGQLGFGKTQRLTTFTPIPMPLQKNERIIKLVAGNSHSFVITNEGRLLGCGNNFEKQIGLTNFRVLTFTPCSIALKKNERIDQLVAGHDHSLILTNTGRLLVCTQHNHFTQQIIHLEENETIVRVVAGNKHSLVLTNAGRIWGCGSKYYKQIKPNETNATNEFTPYDKNTLFLNSLIPKESPLVVNTSKKEFY